MGLKLAIDFGTTNSVVAFWNPELQEPALIALPGLSVSDHREQPPLIPSLVYVQDGRSGEVVLGQSVLDRRLVQERGNRLFRNFKRGILAQPPPEPRLIDGAPWSDQNAGRLFLRGLLEALPYSSQEIEQLVISVPVAAFEGYLSWLSEGVQTLSPEAIRLVDESTAAALGYSVTESGAVVLVFDFGGGSLDLSLVQLPESREKTGGMLKHLLGKSTRQHTARVISKTGLSLGGSDVDQWLLDEALSRCGIPARGLAQDYAALLTVCEQAKIDLSSRDETALQMIAAGKEYQVSLRRDELEAILEAKGFYAAIQRALDKVMHVAQRQGIFAEDIRYVLMVGGASLMPSVQQSLKSYFHDQAVRVDKPFTAVVEGALQLAVGFGLEDYLIHSYGLRYLDAHTGEHRYDEIIPMGSRYPSSKPVTVALGAAHAAQQEVEFVIGEISSEAVSKVDVEYEDGQAVFVAEVSPEDQQIIPLNEARPTLVRLEEPGEPGTACLRAQFTVDEQRQLRLTVDDLKKKKTVLDGAVVVMLMDAVQAISGGISGREPSLAATRARPSQQRLSLRGLGTLLNVLPPEAISLDAASAALRSEQFYVRFSAAELLSKRGDRDARLIMQEALTHGTAPQRASVAHHLHRFSWYVAEPMLRQALGDADLRVSESAVYSLCQLRGAEAYELLQKALSGAEDRLLSAAAWGLSQGPDARAVPVLEIVLQAKDPEVRAKALEVLGATQAPQAAQVVRRALADPDLDVMYAAVLSWIELEGEACFPELARWIADSQGEVSLHLVRALFHASNYLMIDLARTRAVAEIIAALRVALSDDLAETRLTAAMPLAWMRHESATAALQEAYFREQDGEARARLVYTTASLMSPATKAMLQDALSQEDERLRQVAQYIVETLRLEI